MQFCGTFVVKVRYLRTVNFYDDKHKTIGDVIPLRFHALSSCDEHDLISML